jgi:peptidase E
LTNEPCIVATGGGPWLTDPANPLLANYILAQAGKPLPRICNVPTATGDADANIVHFYATFSQLECRPTHLALFKHVPEDIEAFVLAQDIICVGGGNTASMLAVWRTLGLDKALRRAWEHGVVLCGGSAGGICWFEGGPTDSFHPTELRPLSNGLGFLPGSFCPHYDNEAKRRPAFHQMVRDGQLADGIAVEEPIGVRFQGTDLIEAVSSVADKKAWRVQRADGEVIETQLPVRYLGAGP